MCQTWHFSPLKLCTQSQLPESVGSAFLSAGLEFKSRLGDLRRDWGLGTELINVTWQLNQFRSMCCFPADLLSTSPAGASEPAGLRRRPDVSPPGEAGSQDEGHH